MCSLTRAGSCSTSIIIDHVAEGRIIPWWIIRWVWGFHPVFHQSWNVLVAWCIWGWCMVVGLMMRTWRRFGGIIRHNKVCCCCCCWLVKGQSITQGFLGHLDICLQPSLPLTLWMWIRRRRRRMSLLVNTLITPTLFQLLLQMGVPIVFYVVVCPLWKIWSYCSPSATIIY